MNAYHIESVNIQDAEAAVHVAFNNHRNAFRHECDPQMPPIPLAEAVANWQNIPSFMAVNHWLVWNEERTALIASGQLARFGAGQENQHMANFHLIVAPAYRQLGLGRALLAEIVAVAQAENRRLLITESDSSVPAASAFLHQIGAEVGLESTTNQLDLANLNHDLLADWRELGTAASTRYELGFWDGPYPEADLEAVAELYNVMNQAPRDNIEVEDMLITAERLRQREDMQLGRGNERWTAYVRERDTGLLVGFSEMLWRPYNPMMINQGGTGVLPAHRGMSLGKWLKGAMLERVLAERPSARFIRTGNANSNAPMLAINHVLGFRPHLSHTTWQVAVAQVVAYLNGRV